MSIENNLKQLAENTARIADALETLVVSQIDGAAAAPAAAPAPAPAPAAAPAPAPAPAAAPAPAPAPAPAAGGLTADDVNAKLGAIMGAKGLSDGAPILAIIQRIAGTARLTEADPSHYPAILAAVEAEL